jgi:hypothetical protein
VPPTTSIVEAVTLADPESSTAEAELESTWTVPGTEIDALPERFKAPAAVAFSTKIEASKGDTATVEVLVVKLAEEPL